MSAAADTDSVTVTPPPLVAPRSPQEMLAWAVEDRAAMMARAGVTVDRHALAKSIAADFEIADAFDRQAAAPSPADRQRAAATVKAKRVEARAKRDREAGMGSATPTAPSGRVVEARSKILHARSAPTSRWSYAKGRLARIVEGMTPHSNLKIACSTCEMPALALEVFRLQGFVYASQAGRHTGKWKAPRPGDEANPFHGLDPIDFGAKFQRMIEDICDRSTSKLGPWWVPK